MQLKVSDFDIDIVRKDIKNMHLAVYPPTGRVRLAVPKETHEDAIRLFAISKIGWIRRHQRNFKSQERQTEREYIDRESHYFIGKRYLLEIVETDKKQQVILPNKSKIQMFVLKNTPKEKKEELINKWYRIELKKIVEPMIVQWSKKIGVEVLEWKIKKMKTKWGTCNIESKRIWLNLELCKKPLNCIEYIIVHEFIHLIERTHNDRFLELMDKFYPNWKQVRKQLNSLPECHNKW